MKEHISYQVIEPTMPLFAPTASSSKEAVFGFRHVLKLRLVLTLNDSLEDGGDHLDEESLIEEGPSAVKPSEHVYSTGSHTGEDYKDVEKEYGIRNHNSSKEKLTVLEVKTISGRASNIQSVNNVQLKKWW